MRTKSQHKTTSISLKKKFQKLGIEEIAKATGFEIRKSKKITGLNLIAGFFNCCRGNNFSLSLWALHVGENIKKTVSKQAVFNRVNDGFIRFIYELLNKSFSQSFHNTGIILLKKYTNVYLHDSSCIKLPDSLNEFFKGNFSLGKTKSVAKLQIVFNLLKGNLQSFELTSFTKNDQAAAKDILPILKKGDLVIRDLGYFVVNVLQSIKKCGADFVTRLRMDVNIYHPKTGKPIRLKSLLKNKNFVKLKVCIGNKEKMEVTLMAIKTTEKIHDFRKLKALKDRDRRKVVTVEKLNLLGWDIFVCSIDNLTFEEIKMIYRLRWQIEILFKSWKSHLRIEKNMSPNLKNPQLPKAIIYLSLLAACMLILPIYRIHFFSKKKIKKLSLLKLTKFFLSQPFDVHWEISCQTIENIIYHSIYDRRKRLNLEDKLISLT